MQQRRKDPPAGIKLVITNEIGMVALESVEYQRFVGFGNLEVREAAPVGEVEFGGNGLHAQAGQLRVHFDVHRLVRLHANHKLVARNVLENA